METPKAIDEILEDLGARVVGEEVIFEKPFDGNIKLSGNEVIITTKQGEEIKVRGAKRWHVKEQTVGEGSVGIDLG